ncbi:DUF4864 domain-containing protein [Rubellimicrobium aerolatum]|uniref:DUF4864 domain-containing protein n=1 Tax=Rubellimicrobium aerolatum TaxID=490979 RepID=A0ABW0SGS5_9RHOB|nr:DUF4864 domain-containing protein [Rubellimicrobium aerolatum]MBP1807465.1 hypothetical protein [Rubellimicrobium aerolatum]
MRRLTILAVMLLAGPALAQDAEDRAEIAEVIEDQLSDFVARDVAGAWDHASPTIQGMFGTPERFARMVEGGYPMVWDNRDAEMGALREEDGALRQAVRVEDAEGRGWLLDYEMVETPEGWRINGVGVRPAPDLAA